jgi:DNA-binding response OmpR family regulator
LQGRSKGLLSELFNSTLFETFIVKRGGRLMMPMHIKDYILVVMPDNKLRDDIIETLEDAGGYSIVSAETFKQALAEITLIDFDLIITCAELPDLSGLDLLTAVTKLRPNSSVIIIDEELSPKSAVALFRMGAVDYLYKPLTMSFLLMQVDRQMQIKRLQRSTLPEPIVSASTPQALAALTFNRHHFQRIELELNRLLSHIQADFIGLFDSDGNLLGTSGVLHDDASQLLMQGLQVSMDSFANIDPTKTKYPTSSLHTDSIGVYIVQVGYTHRLWLTAICPEAIPANIIWLYSKRTGASLKSFLEMMT